jgi:NAD(P)-dependent dehydrogenase (short-subunit alcohol dehydrogenase family)
MASTDIASQHGKRAIITGTNSGIGYYTAATLARHGADVVLACRSERRGADAVARLDNEIPDAQVRFEPLARAGLDSVRAFARREIDSGRPLDSLVNNAGVMAPAKRISTIDGFELQFGTNVLGHFALTALLLPTLDAAAIRDERPRIVTVASIAHKSGRIGFEDLQSQHGYRPIVEYRQSKLAILMIAFELARGLHAMGSRVMSVA